VVLDATDSNRVVREHAGQDQLGATGCTTHHSHSNCTHSEHPFVLQQYRL
jgi:hypothetical protein